MNRMRDFCSGYLWTINVSTTKIWAQLSMVTAFFIIILLLLLFNSGVSLWEMNISRLDTMEKYTIINMNCNPYSKKLTDCQQRRVEKFKQLIVQLIHVFVKNAHMKRSRTYWLLCARHKILVVYSSWDPVLTPDLHKAPVQLSGRHHL